VNRVDDIDLDHQIVMDKLHRIDIVGVRAPDLGNREVYFFYVCVIFGDIQMV
jgi:hypothetical protein